MLRSVPSLLLFGRICISINFSLNIRKWQAATITAMFHERSPFKFKLTTGNHSVSMNCVQFSFKGNRFAMARAYGQIYIYDEKTGENVHPGKSEAHNRGIYAISWSSDSTHFLSSSGDETSKIFDVKVNCVINVFMMGYNILDQKLGCLWQKGQLFSIFLSGYTITWTKTQPQQTPEDHQQSHQISSVLTVHKNGSRSYIYSRRHDRHINYWDFDMEENDSLSGKGHGNQVSRMTMD